MTMCCHCARIRRAARLNLAAKRARQKAMREAIKARKVIRVFFEDEFTGTRYIDYRNIQRVTRYGGEK